MKSGSQNSDLLVIAQHFWPEMIGSAPYCTDLALWAASRNFKTEVLTNRPYYPFGEVLSGYREGEHDSSDLKGVSVERLKVKVPDRDSAVSRAVSEMIFFVRSLFSLATGRVRRSSHVISFVPSILSVVLGWIATKRGGSHHVIVHDIQSGLVDGLGMAKIPGLVWLMRAVERFALNRPDKVFVLSSQMAEALREIGIRRQIEIAPIWVDLEKVVPKPQAANAPTRVVYSGNLGKKQGVDTLIELASTLNDLAPEIGVVIRGAGSEEERLKEKASRLNIANLLFEPLVPPEEFAQALSEATLFVVPQDPRGDKLAVPSKVFSIMAAGRTFVATSSSGGTLDILSRDSRAFKVVEPGDVASLAREVVRLVDAKERVSMENSGRKYVEEYASRDYVLETVFRGLSG